MRTLLSIVIANYNYGRYLESAIRSILNQCESAVADLGGRHVLPVKGADFCVELIVCDAGSQDNSISIIAKYEHSIAWWVSEPDKGQSDAFNKGFHHACGEYLTWLNSDDFFTRDAFILLWRHILKQPNASWVSANNYFFSDEDGLITHIQWGPNWTLPLFQRQKIPAAVFGPSSFIRSDVFQRVGEFDIDVHFGMDTAYWHRMHRMGYRQSRLSKFLWGFRVHGDSKTMGEQSVLVQQKRTAENRQTLERYGSAIRLTWRDPWYCLWMLCRLIDGSLIVSLYYRLVLRRASARTALCGRLWFE